MTNKPTIRVDGLNRFVRDLKRVSPDLAAELKVVNRDLADDVAGVAQGLAPTGPTGRLAASVRAGATQRSGVVKAGKKAVPYAGVIHFGWIRRGIRPRPFLYDALDSRRAEVERRYLDALEKIAGDVGTVA